MDIVLQLTRLSGPVFALNPDLIERAEATPDTVVTLVNGSKYVIRESLTELLALIREHRADLVAAAAQISSELAGSGQSTMRTAVARSSNGRRESTMYGTVVPLHPEAE
jgi:flagellar protein FlbD